MKISSKQYAVTLFELAKDKQGKELEQVLANFAKILLERNDHFLQDKIILEFETLWHKEYSIVKVEIESVRKLSAEITGNLVEKIKKMTKAKAIILTEKINEEVIGGAVIKYNDQILDLSLRTRLRKFKESLAL